MSEDQDDALPIFAEERERLFTGLGRCRLAVCVSGGADSMALMHLLAEWAADRRQVQRSGSGKWDAQQRREPRPEQMPTPAWLQGVATREDLSAVGGLAPIVVLSIDHGLRPEAAEETRFVAAEAKRLGFPHQILKSDEPPPETGIQEWARKLRHRLILELLDAESWSLIDFGLKDEDDAKRHIVMAHHLDDQAETVLMRLARGSGAVGLGGMSEHQWLEIGPGRGRPYSIGTHLVRPLLSVPKARLRATLKAKGAAWREDHSNADCGFERVRIRSALEDLRGLGVTAKGIARSASRLRAAEDSFMAFERCWERDIVSWNEGLFAEIETRRFVSRGQYAGVRLLQRILAAFGGASRAAGLSQVERLWGLLLGEEGPFKGSTLGGCRIELAGDLGGGSIHVCREGQGDGLGRAALVPGNSIEWDGGRFRVAAEADARPADVGALGADGWARLKRAVDGLDELGLKAAAMATLPAIWRSDDLIGLPFLDVWLPKRATSGKVLDAWSKWCFSEKDAYDAVFTGLAAHPTGAD